MKKGKIINVPLPEKIEEGMFVYHPNGCIYEVKVIEPDEYIRCSIFSGYNTGEWHMWKRSELRSLYVKSEGEVYQLRKEHWLIASEKELIDKPSVVNFTFDTQYPEWNDMQAIDYAYIEYIEDEFSDLFRIIKLETKSDELTEQIIRAIAIEYSFTKKN